MKKKKGLGRKKQADETPRTERGFFFPSSSSHPLHFFPLHIGDAGRRRELSFFCRRELEAKIGIQTSRLSLSLSWIFFFSFLLPNFSFDFFFGGFRAYSSCIPIAPFLTHSIVGGFFFTKQHLQYALDQRARSPSVLLSFSPKQRGNI